MNIIQKTLTTLSIILTAGFFIVPAMAPSAAFAGPFDGARGQACRGANLGEGGCGGAAGTLTKTVRTVVNIFSTIIGIAAVIMIMIGGFRYITSGGDSNSITSAKHTILYAIVGLIIVALAQVIVRFVLNQAT